MPAGPKRAVDDSPLQIIGGVAGTLALFKSKMK
jgi:hypothetical protein